jgi:hypothetical protein
VTEGGSDFQAFVEAMRRGLQTFASAQARAATWAQRIQESLQPALEALAANSVSIAEVMLGAKKYAADAHVENWTLLDENEWMRAITLMRSDDGVPLAWVPPADIVKLLVAATDHDERDAVLIDNADAILAHAREVLDQVTHPDLTELRTAVEEGWEAIGIGLTRPAQTVAAAAVGEIVQKQLTDFDRLGKFRERWDAHRRIELTHWSLATDLRFTAVMSSVSVALQGNGHGHPRTFNRHATLHGFDPIQHTPANALRGLMLATSATRELQYMNAVEWRTTPLSAASRGLPPISVRSPYLLPGETYPSIPFRPVASRGFPNEPAIAGPDAEAQDERESPEPR